MCACVRACVCVQCSIDFADNVCACDGNKPVFLHNDGLVLCSDV